MKKPSLCVALCLQFFLAFPSNAQTNGHSTFLVFDPYDAVLCGLFGSYLRAQSYSYLFGEGEEQQEADRFLAAFEEYTSNNEQSGDTLHGRWLRDFYNEAEDYLLNNEKALQPSQSGAYDELVSYMSYTHYITGEFVDLYANFIERTATACISAYEMGQLQPYGIEPP